MLYCYTYRNQLELKPETLYIFPPTPVCSPDEDFLTFWFRLYELGKHNSKTVSGNELSTHICALGTL